MKFKKGDRVISRLVHHLKGTVKLVNGIIWVLLDKSNPGDPYVGFSPLDLRHLK